MEQTPSNPKKTRKQGIPLGAGIMLIGLILILMGLICFMLLRFKVISCGEKNAASSGASVTENIPAQGSVVPAETQQGTKTERSLHPMSRPLQKSPSELPRKRRLKSLPTLL